jgi:hypothetical protein
MIEMCAEDWDLDAEEDRLLWYAQIRVWWRFLDRPYQEHCESYLEWWRSINGEPPTPSAAPGWPEAA